MGRDIILVIHHENHNWDFQSFCLLSFYLLVCPILELSLIYIAIQLFMCHAPIDLEGVCFFGFLFKAIYFQNLGCLFLYFFMTYSL